MISASLQQQQLLLQGELTYPALSALEAQKASWQQVREVSLQQVSKIDSAGLAWLYCWFLQRQAAQQGWQLVDLSAPFVKLCTIYGVSYTTHPSEQQSD